MTRILITGAARGIGAEAARKLAARGAKVVVAGLEPELLERVAADCPGGAAFECDVSDTAAVERTVEAAAAHLGGLDAVVANAGIASTGLLRSSDPEAVERIVQVNLLGVWRTLRFASPHLMASQGYALAIASMAAFIPAPTMTAYGMTKAGVEMLADGLRIELGHHGVGVGVGYFSWIDTEMVRGADRHEVGSTLRSRLRWPLNRTYPVADAAEAVVRGVERRSRWVMHPPWLRLLLPARGVIPLLAQRELLRHMPAAEEAWERALAEQGAAASEPVGAGGAADSASRTRSAAGAARPR